MPPRRRLRHIAGEPGVVAAAPGGQLRAPRPRFAPPVRFQMSHVEAAAWIVIGGIAILFRLLRLGDAPLRPAESVLAYDSLRIVLDHGVSVSSSPLLIYLNSLVFLAGPSDTLARMIPALLGCLIALSPLFMRSILGRFGSLAAALLLATSPSLVFVSRSVDGTVLALVLGLGLVVFADRYLSFRAPRDLYLAAVSAALLLISGPSAYDLIVAFVTYAAARLFLGEPVGAVYQPGALGITAPGFLAFRRRVALEGLLPDSATMARVGIVFAATLVFGATALLTNVEGIGDAVANPIGIWAMSFQSGSHPVWLYPLILLTYEPASVILGIVGIVATVERRRPFVSLLTWWAAVVFVLMMLNVQRDPKLVALLVLPLALIAGAWLDRIPTMLRARSDWGQCGILAIGVAAFTSTLLIALGNASLDTPAVPRWLMLAPILALAIYLTAFARWFGPKALQTAGTVVGFGLLILVSVHGATALNFTSATNPAELFLGATTSPDARVLAHDVGIVLDELQIEQQLDHKNVTMNVEVDRSMKAPLAWYLQGDSGVQFVDSIFDSPAIAIGPVTDKQPAGSYASQEYQLGKTAPLGFRSPWSFWAWWMTRTAPSTAEYAKVYVKKQITPK